MNKNYYVVAVIALSALAGAFLVFGNDKKLNLGGTGQTYTHPLYFLDTIGIGDAYQNGRQWAGGGIFDAGKAPLQVTNNVNDLKNNIVISNMNTGAYAAGCLTFYNASSTTGLTGNAYGDICYSGPNFNSATAPGGGLAYGSIIPGLPANSLVQVATRGMLLFGSLSATSTEAGITWSVGPGYQTGNYDMVLNDLDPTQFPNDRYLANLGIGTTSPIARLSIVASSTAGLSFFLLSSSTNATQSTVGTVAQQTVFVVNNLGHTGIGLRVPTTRLHVNDYTATSTITASVVSDTGTRSTTRGGRLILQDVTGATCTEVTAKSGVLTAKAVTCP